MAGGLIAGRRTLRVETRRRPFTDPQTRLAAVVCLLVLNGLDVLTTRHLLLAHGGIEANPLSVWLIAHGLLGAAKAGVVVCIGWMAVRLPARRASSVALWLAVGFYLAVVL